VRIIFMGTPGFSVAPLRHLVLNQYQVTAVYTQPDKPAGRGRSLVASPVKRAAEEMRLPVFQPASIKGAEQAAQIAEHRPDVIVVSAYGQVLPQAVLDIPVYGCVNIHPSLLPRHRGASPVAASILAGDVFTGVSIILMDASLDTGPVLARASIPVSPLDTTGSLSDKLSQVAARTLQETLVRWTRGEIAPQPQNEAETDYASPVNREESEIDWQRSSIDIWRRIRAFQPWPKCYTMWQGKRLEILEAKPRTVGVYASPGQVVLLGAKGSGFGIGTGLGVLDIMKVQLEGKKPVTASAFLMGQRQFAGAILLS